MLLLPFSRLEVYQDCSSRVLCESDFRAFGHGVFRSGWGSCVLKDFICAGTLLRISFSTFSKVHEDDEVSKVGNPFGILQARLTDNSKREDACVGGVPAERVSQARESVYATTASGSALGARQSSSITSLQTWFLITSCSLGMRRDGVLDGTVGLLSPVPMTFTTALSLGGVSAEYGLSYSLMCSLSWGLSSWPWGLFKNNLGVSSV